MLLGDEFQQFPDNATRVKGGGEAEMCGRGRRQGFKADQGHDAMEE